MAADKNRYTRIIELIFSKNYRTGAKEVPFERSAIVQASRELGIRLPKNLGDVLYSFRYRTPLPESIVKTAPTGLEWIIRPAGRSKYKLVLVAQSNITPSNFLTKTKILDATPGVISKYALSDEQALLAKLRYNRLIDIFTGLTCYSLQNHLRTTAPQIGQVEIDEIYIGIDKHGANYILPVQGKVRADKIGVVQIEQDFAVCEKKFPDLVCRAIAAQFMDDGLIALFEFEKIGDRIQVACEKHYNLVHPNDLTPEELRRYQKRSS